ncbi:MAG: PRC-barrel domain-containing protein, partial [Ilumatobacteraceae bacterium]
MNTMYVNRRLFHSTGQKIGTVTDVIHDPHDLEPEWLAVRVGLFRREYLVPVSQVETVAGRLVTSLDRTLVTSTPAIHDHFRPTPGQQASVLRDYGLTEADMVPTDCTDPSGWTPLNGSEGFAYAGMEADVTVVEHGASGFVVVLDEAVGATLVRTLGEAVGNGPALVHLVVPVNPVDAAAEGDPRAEGDEEVADIGSTVAEWHLSSAIRQLSALGFAADGVIAGED